MEEKEFCNVVEEIEYMLEKEAQLSLANVDGAETTGDNSKSSHEDENDGKHPGVNAGSEDKETSEESENSPELLDHLAAKCAAAIKAQ